MPLNNTRKTATPLTSDKEQKTLGTKLWVKTPRIPPEVLEKLALR